MVGAPPARRVLVFCPALATGGADRVVITLLRLLDRARFAPQLVLVRRTGQLADEVPADVPVHVLGTARLAVSAPALARVIRATQPDIVFSMHGGSNVIVALAHALARSRARLVLSERSALIRTDRGYLRRLLENRVKRLSYRRADLVTAVSRGLAADLVARLGLPAAKVVTIYNPIVDDELGPLAAAPVDHPFFAAGDRTPVILAVGRLVAIKDYPTLLAAFATIRASRSARLVILGEGPLLDELVDRVAALGLARDVAFLGFDKNPFKYMARATLVLHASRAEGLPGALVQAMACGTPVVSTDCDFGPREIITTGEDGYLVPVGDSAQLAARTLQVLDDPALATGLGQRARDSARRFTTAASLACYEAAIAGTHA